MKTITLLLFVLFSINAWGQSPFAIIADKDGYTNVRSGAGKSNKITDTLHNNHLIYCLENQGNWSYIFYPKGPGEEDGWVYNDRYIMVSALPSIPATTKTHNSLKLNKDSIQVIITTKKFQKEKHTIKYIDGGSLTERIDNKPIWGTDGNMPETEYQSITVKIGQNTITLPQSALVTLYQPNLEHTKAHLDKTSNTLYIHSLNSDGAGGYAVIWKIENGVYKERFVTHGF